MKILSFIMIVLISFSSCKKENLGNKGACENGYNQSNTNILIEESENNTFCLLPALNYQISVENWNLHAINWNTGDTTALIPVNDFGLYNGSGINNNNDTISFSFEAVNCNNAIYIPTAFTPNGDGINDTWEIIFLEELICSEDFDLTIFNSSHQMIFESATLSNSWDGTQTGLPAPLGLYHFMAHYKEKNGKMKELTGQFLLIR